MQKPPPPRPKSKSSDDLEGVAALDAAESRATAALRLMNEERAAREAAEGELERLRAAEAKRQLDTVAKAAQAAPKIEMAAPSVRPGVLTVQAKGVKIGIPIALLTPVLALIWAGYQNYTELQRQVKALQTVMVNKDTRLESIESRLNELTAAQSTLRETQAAQAGWITGAFPKAGVNVPGTGIEVKSDPLPLGARRQTQVNLRTPVPTPPSK